MYTYYIDFLNSYTMTISKFVLFVVVTRYSLKICAIIDLIINHLYSYDINYINVYIYM